MKSYSIIPTDWDYNHSDKIREIQTEQGYFTPSLIPEIQRACGNLNTTNEKKAIEYAKKLKSTYPYICFALTIGSCWGDMEMVQSF